MATNDTRDYYTNYKVTRDSFEMLKHFETMYHKVEQMIASDTTYSTWIRIQFGKGNAPITFNTASPDKKENIIANLEIKTSGAGVANEFKFTAIWDPFNSGQDTTAKVQGLDEILAIALSCGASTDSDTLRGYIQFGYNVVGDESLVSPKYEMMITGAQSHIEYTTGIVTYSFSGHSILALDCDCNKFTYEECKDWNLMDFANWHLYYYYGDPDEPPYKIDKGTGTFKNPPKYKIDIPVEYFTSCGKITVPPQANDQTPWQYVLGCLNSSKETRMLENDKKIDDYVNKWDELTPNQLPYWDLYITDSDKTIHVVHCSPLANKDIDIKGPTGQPLLMNYPITWGTQSTNLVTKWDSSIDLQLYLVAKRSMERTVAQAKAKVDEAQKKWEEAQLQYNAFHTKKNEQESKMTNKLPEDMNVTVDSKGNINAAPLPGVSLPTNVDPKSSIPTYRQVAMNNAKAKQEETLSKVQYVSPSTGKVLSTNPRADAEKLKAEELKIQIENKATLIKLSNNVKQYYDELVKAQNEAQYNKQFYDFEKYEATISLVGIPADIAPCTKLIIIPRILESVPNRQSGCYSVTGCTHVINTSGVFETTLDVFRLMGLNDVNQLVSELINNNVAISSALNTNIDVLTTNNNN